MKNKRVKLFLALIGLNILFSTVSQARHFSVNLKSINGNFVVAENGGGGLVNANRPSAREWETFILLDLNDGELENGDEVAIKTINGNFFSAFNGGGDKLLADKTGLFNWETFKIERISSRTTDNLIQDSDLVAFKTTKGNYVSALNGGGGEVNAKPTAIGNNEKFRISMPTRRDRLFNGEPAAGKLSGPFTAPQMIIRPVVGVDDLARTEGDVRWCKNDYFGQNFPACYRGHEGTDFILAGHILAQSLGSIDVYTVAGGKVVAVFDGNTDKCFFKPNKFDSKSEEFIFCVDGKEVSNEAKDANFVAILQDDGIIAYYFHLKKNSIVLKEKQRVESGQLVGKIGSSGISSVPHFHLTMQRIKPLSELEVAKDSNGNDVDSRFKKFPKDREDFKIVAGWRAVAKIINPYSPMLWTELSGQVPKKVSGDNRAAGEENQPCSNLTQCKFGLVCQNGKCQKPALPNITPPGCGNCPPFTECKDGKCVPKKP